MDRGYVYCNSIRLVDPHLEGSLVMIPWHQNQIWSECDTIHLFNCIYLDNLLACLIMMHFGNEDFIGAGATWPGHFRRADEHFNRPLPGQIQIVWRITHVVKFGHCGFMFGYMTMSYTGWRFGAVFIFPYIENNHPNWLICFRGVETTNQIYTSIKSITCSCRLKISPRILCSWILNQDFSRYDKHVSRSP